MSAPLRKITKEIDVLMGVDMSKYRSTISTVFRYDRVTTLECGHKVRRRAPAQPLNYRARMRCKECGR